MNESMLNDLSDSGHIKKLLSRYVYFMCMKNLIKISANTCTLSYYFTQNKSMIHQAWSFLK